MADPQMASEGLANLSHAIRRSTALYVAMMVSPEGTTDDQLLARAERFAGWVNGRAGAVQQAAPDEGFMGVNPWNT